LPSDANTNPLTIKFLKAVDEGKREEKGRDGENKRVIRRGRRRKYVTN
jgi:hypothetical protein